MNNNAYTPDIITQENIRFSIPLYQRLFAWGSREVNTLLHDLDEHFKKNVNNEPYYLGILTCIDNSDVFDLIDGQQRMTVMTLLGVELQKIPFPNESNPWNKFLDSGNRLSFTARSEDKEYLRKKILSISDTKSYVNKNMDLGLQTISSFLEKKTMEEKIEFAKNVFYRLSFFFAELPTSYSKEPAALNKYFEIMNSTGKGLEQHEILKVELLRNNNDSEYLTLIWNLLCDMDKPVIRQDENVSIEDYRKLYTDAIRCCVDGYYEGAINVARKSSTDNTCKSIAEIKPKQHNFTEKSTEGSEKGIMSFPEYLLLMLNHIVCNSSNNSESFFRSDKLLERFESNPIIDVKTFYHKMLLYRLLLDFYVIKRDTMSGSTNYILYYNDSDSDKRATNCIKQFQSMLYVSADYYQWVMQFLTFVENAIKNNMPLDAATVLAQLKYIDKQNHPQCPTALDLGYNSQYSGKRYWFWRLDYILWENREILKDNDGNTFFTEEEQQIIENYKFRSNRSIEHLHPQDQSYNDDWDDESVNSFANLAMISQSFNSTQSNDPVHVKFARIEDQANNAALQSIKLYRMYLIAKHEANGLWKKEMLRSHEEEMIELIKALYRE